MSVSIVKDNKIILNKGYGIKEDGKGAPINENTLFAIASNTKAFISSALAQLVSEDEIDWDDRVVDYLPHFEVFDPYVTSEVTIEDLLCHRVGLGTFSGDVIWYKSELEPKEIISRIKYLPQAFSFRNGYGYSNLMFIAAGEVIKTVTGQDWDDYITRSFFEPLRMNRTVTSIDELASKGNFATPHKVDQGKNIPIEWTNWDNMGAAGGIISSSSDMARWIQLNLNSGILESDTLIAPTELLELWTIHNSFYLSAESREWIPGRHFNGYGLGWGTFDYFGRQVVTHSGGYDGMYSRVVLIPDEDLGFAILTNNMTGISNALMMYLINAFIKEDLRDWSLAYLERPGSGGVAEDILTKKDSRKDGTTPSLNLESYEGIFYDPMYGSIQTKLENGSLKLKFENAPQLSATLGHWHYDTWEIKWDEIHAWFDFGTLKFNLNNDNEVIGISFDVPNYDIFFHEINAIKQN